MGIVRGLIEGSVKTVKVERRLAVFSASGALRPSPRGGAREGAGAKPLGEEPMRRYNVMLDLPTVQVLRRLGKRNLSAGIRSAAAQVKEKA